jgi:hypothetical protein
LLSSLLRCKTCSGSMVVVTFKRPHGKGVARYACSRNHKRSANACRNNTGPMMAEIDALVLDEIEDKVLTPQHVRDAAARAAKLDAERRRTRPDEEARLQAAHGAESLPRSRRRRPGARGRVGAHQLTRGAHARQGASWPST